LNKNKKINKFISMESNQINYIYRKYGKILRNLIFNNGQFSEKNNQLYINTINVQKGILNNVNINYIEFNGQENNNSNNFLNNCDIKDITTEYINLINCNIDKINSSENSNLIGCKIIFVDNVSSCKIDKCFIYDIRHFHNNIFKNSYLDIKEGSPYFSNNNTFVKCSIIINSESISLKYSKFENCVLTNKQNYSYYNDANKLNHCIINNSEVNGLYIKNSKITGISKIKNCIIERDEVQIDPSVEILENVIMVD